MRFVVAGAVVRSAPDGRRELLLAQRRRPPEVAGLWELPGGKVDDGESPADALVRELQEELDVVVTVGERLTERVALRADLTMVALWAAPTEGEPRAVEHQALAWVDADALRVRAAHGTLVPADTAWLPELLAHLDESR
ncbi:MAG: NUDIX domain-containing protein [Gordonia sp. (in: high G+C Gram-positive bacteria)]|uniref:(deoxy)nucleoside triphosphate pyrophosphohydrolase n=1 Tax=Gordonia sp. (in: high G+C Gram-positive bacteria) TaxID=84139 RepID=UPI0039E5D21A